MGGKKQVRGGRLIRIESGSETLTQLAGTKIGRAAGAGCFIALYGGLGAGKSVFARGVARGLGVASPVQSPTYTLLNVYEEGRLPFYHFDAYRLGSEDELEALGYEDCFFGSGVTVFEWAQRVEGLLPQDRLDVSICAGKDENHRVIELTPLGEAATRLLKEACL